MDIVNLIILADVEEEEEEDPNDEEDPLGQEDNIGEEEEEPLGQNGEEPPPKIKGVSIELRNVRILYFLSLNCKN